jgi:NAD dependent epimerase/dehydratase family enzyme
VCRAWEAAFDAAATPLTRKIALRVSLVLGPDDGVFPRLKNLIRFGLGGPQGPGTQYFSWIHEQDFARMTEWLMQRSDLSGVFNVAAPEAVPNRVFMSLARKAAGVPFGLPAPSWLLEIGARVIGTETELILKSRFVEPERLMREGFVFSFPTPGGALEDLFKGRR